MSTIAITYTSGGGQAFNLKADTLRLKSANFHTQEWEPVGVRQQYGEIVSYFTRRPAQYEAVIYYTGAPESRARRAEELHLAAEADLRLNRPGTLTFGTWSIKAFILEQEMAPVEDGNTATADTLLFYCPYPFWREKRKRSFFLATADADFLDYPHGMPYDFGVLTSQTQSWNPGTLFPCDFEMTIFGPANDPAVEICGHTYGVHTDLLQGEYLTINSDTRTITKTTGGGNVTNIFGLRDLSSDIFHPIPAGVLTVTWEGSFTLDLVVFASRSDPAWPR